MENKEESIITDILHKVNIAKPHIIKFRNAIDNKDIMVCVGNSRSGKSTVVNYVLGNDLESFEDTKRTYIKKVDSVENGPGIGQGALSHTKFPTVWKMKEQEDTVIVDAPGFDDNRGIAHDVVNTLFFNELKFARSVRFILVSDICDIDTDNVRAFTNVMTRMQNIIYDFNELKDSVALVFTKDFKQYKRTDIATLLKNKIIDIPEMDVKKDLIDHISKRANVIGIFRMPPYVGLVAKEEVDRNVSDAIYNTRPIVRNIRNVTFSLPERAHHILLDLYQTYSVQMNFPQEVEKLVRQFEKYFKIDKYVFASTEEELGETKIRLGFALPRITTEKTRNFTNLKELKISLGSIAGILCEDFERKLNFFIAIDELLLLDDNIKHILITNYKNALINLENEINNLIAKIDTEVETRTTETVQYILSEAASDKTKFLLLGASLIPIAKKTIAMVGLQIPETLAFEVVELTASSCGFAAAGGCGAAAGCYGALYYKSIYLRKKARKEQGR